MPNYFELARKSNPEAGPVVLQELDEELCKHFGVPCDAKRYLGGWYDSIGLSLAMGDTFEEIIAYYRTTVVKYHDDAEFKQAYSDLIQIAEYIQLHFISHCGYSHTKA